MVTEKEIGMNLKLPDAFQVIGRSVVDWWDSWLDLVGAVVVWILAQVTIVLGPPATFGLYYTAHALVNGESLGWRGVVEGGRKYFGKSWLWFLLSALGFMLIYSNIQFYGMFDNVWAAYAQIFFVLVGYVWLVAQFYALAFLVEMKEKKLLFAIRNGFFVGMASPLFSLLIILFGMVVMAFSVILVLPVFFGMPALFPILGVRAVYNRLEAYGLREREKTPKELEREQTGRIEFPGKNSAPGGEKKL